MAQWVATTPRRGCTREQDSPISPCLSVRDEIGHTALPVRSASSLAIAEPACVPPGPALTRLGFSATTVERATERRLAWRSTFRSSRDRPPNPDFS